MLRIKNPREDFSEQREQALAAIFWNPLCFRVHRWWYCYSLAELANSAANCSKHDRPSQTHRDVETMSGPNGNLDCHTWFEIESVVLCQHCAEPTIQRVNFSRLLPILSNEKCSWCEFFITYTFLPGLVFVRLSHFSKNPPQWKCCPWRCRSAIQALSSCTTVNVSVGNIRTQAEWFQLCRATSSGRLVIYWALHGTARFVSAVKYLSKFW